MVRLWRGSGTVGGDPASNGFCLGKIGGSLEQNFKKLVRSPVVALRAVRDSRIQNSRVLVRCNPDRFLERVNSVIDPARL